MKTHSPILCLVWAILSPGCHYPAPDCADGYTRTESGDCAGSGVGADSADSADSGVTGDTGAEVNTGPSALSGAIEIQIFAETGGIVIEDACVGTVAFEVDEQALSGTLSCVFGGTVASFIGEAPFAGTIDGVIEADGGVSGPFWMDLDTFGVLDTSWSGTFDQTQLDGTLSDQMVFELGSLQVPVDYSGVFNAR